MVNSEILGGLKLALSKGESLKRAMMTFYNVGYKKEEIEEAARALKSQQFEQKEIVQQKPKPESEKKIKQPVKKPIIKRKQVQRVSAYGEPSPVKDTYPKKAISEKSIQEKKPKQVQRVSAYTKSANVKKPQLLKKDIESIKEQLKETKDLVQESSKKTAPQIESNYGQVQNTKGKLIIILLIVSLLFLVGALVAVFLFKQELIDFFNRLS